MKIKGIFLGWIVVKNMDSAIKFYTQVMGLTLKEHSKEYGWAELSGPDGAILGIAQENQEFNMKAGTNAVMTITVDNIVKAIEDLKKKGANLQGDVMEIPGEVKLQSLVDADGNMFQIVEKLN